MLTVTNRTIIGTELVMTIAIEVMMTVTLAMNEKGDQTVIDMIAIVILSDMIEIEIAIAIAIQNVKDMNLDHSTEKDTMLEVAVQQQKIGMTIEIDIMKTDMTGTDGNFRMARVKQKQLDKNVILPKYLRKLETDE
eukprot:TRINITY_DN376_c0_g1_i1.p2 TRINITY_DN376_c0_g1~~TRINITY_DN376_c0_g1_i1.p2  ORF type:complete len:136 (+),score=0.19 TRINITY_DN376_c0_g1_i1:398-805(+)